VARREHREVTGPVIAELVTVEARLRLVVAHHLHEPKRLGLPDQRVIAVQVLAVHVAARVGGPAVTVDRRHDQHGHV
jgi:hypothetical protein